MFLLCRLFLELQCYTFYFALECQICTQIIPYDVCKSIHVAAFGICDNIANSSFFHKRFKRVGNEVGDLTALYKRTCLMRHNSGGVACKCHSVKLWHVFIFLS